MYQVPEQLIRANNAGVETLVIIASAAFGGIERLTALNLNAARMLLEDSAANTRVLLAVKDMKALASLQAALAQPGLEKANTYSRSLFQIATETQGAMSGVVEGQVAELGRSANRVFDKAVKAA
jgi:phasin family protein